MNRLDVIGLSDAIVDQFFDTDENELANLELKKGSFAGVSSSEQIALLTKLNRQPKLVQGGGTVTNSLAVIKQLGGSCGLIACIADDHNATVLENELNLAGIEFLGQKIANQSTGLCLSLVSPDGDRTMRTCVEVSNFLHPDRIDESAVARSKWLYISGYMLARGTLTWSAVIRATELAQKHGTKIAFTLSDTWLIKSFRSQIEELLPKVDLLFGNQAEICELVSQSDFTTALCLLKEKVANYVITLGDKGVQVRYDGKDFYSPAFPCTPVDLTGAGDMFAGAFLYGITRAHFNIDEVLRRACYLSMQVISKVGARLESAEQVLRFWDEAPTLS